MQRRTAIAGLALALVATAAVAAVLTQSGPDRVQLTDERDAADRVTLYQNGVAFVELNRTFTAGPGDEILELPVPSTTVLDSLRVEGDGVRVREVRASPGLEGPVQVGDEVRVRTADRTYRGVLVDRADGELVLARDSNATVVREEAVEAVEIDGRSLADADPTAARVSVLADAEAGNRTVRVTYLARGPSWHPSYDLDLDGGRTTFFATLAGLHTWKNVTVDLVSGTPNLAIDPEPVPSRGREDVTDDGGGGFESGFSNPASLGELHRYRLDRTTNLTSGETVRLPVRTGQLESLRDYRSVRASVGFGDDRGDRQRVDVLERHEVESTFDEPLPPGVVRFYRQGTWVGEDDLEALPAGGTANLTVSRSIDVTADVRLANVESTAERETRTYVLTVENAKTDGEAVDLEAELSYPSFRTNLVDAEPEPDRASGTTVRWLADLPAGETASFRLTYEQLER